MKIIYNLLTRFCRLQCPRQLFNQETNRDLDPLAPSMAKTLKNTREIQNFMEEKMELNDMFILMKKKTFEIHILFLTIHMFSLTFWR